MQNDLVEEKRNQLNLEIRGLLALIEFIDGEKKEYTNYITDVMNESEFLDQQIQLAKEAKERLLNIFKD